MNWGFPSFTRYFVVLVLALLLSLYLINDFRNSYPETNLFGVQKSTF